MRTGLRFIRPSRNISSDCGRPAVPDPQVQRDERMRKRLQAAVLCLCLLAGGCAGVSVPAQALAAQQSGAAAFDEAGRLPTGRIPVEETTIAPGEDVTCHRSGGESRRFVENMRGAAVGQSEWDRYKNYYFYNQMDGPRRAFWDELDAICMKYLTTQADAHLTQGKWHLDFLGSGYLTHTQMKDLMCMFRYLNPQYYFINQMLYTQTINGESFMAFGIYPSFADGAARAVETARVKTAVASWQSQIDACASEEEKVRKIHDLIVEKVDYNDAIYDKDFDESTQYSQSVYSVFCMDRTVCAGYAQSFAMMCNGSGIDAVSVTSEEHEWNKVRINDSWYNVDCTWDDQSVTSYLYFERNDYFYDVTDYQNRLQHKEENCWEGYLPVCSLDSAPVSFSASGTLPAITETTAAPVIRTWESGLVTIACDTAGAGIYYSLDGGDPAPASVKCEPYTQPFAADGREVRAVAVCDGKWDSRVVSSLDDNAGGNGTGGSDRPWDGGDSVGGGNGAGGSGKPWDGGDSVGGGSGSAGDGSPGGSGGAGDSGTGGSGGAGSDSEQAGKSLAGAKIRLSKTTYDYNGKARKPAVTVTLGGKTLAGGADYTVSYRNNKNIGTAAVVVTGKGGYSGKAEKTFSIKARKGSVFAVKGLRYRITGSSEAAFAGTESAKTTKVVIPASVKIGGRSFKVTSVADKALKNRKKVTSVTVGKNVKTIGREAFAGCKKLRKLTISSTKLKSVGKNALKGIPSDARIKVPAGKQKKYQKLFQKKGQGSQVRIEK